MAILIAAGARLGAANAHGDHPIHMSASPNLHDVRGACLELLLAAGVDPDVRGGQGHAPLHAAARSSGSSWACVEILIARGARVDVRDQRGRSPLSFAVEAGSAGAAQALWAAGADAGAVARDGSTIDDLASGDARAWVAALRERQALSATPEGALAGKSRQGL